MSDKVALVRLRAENAQYDAAMRKSRGETEALGVTAKKTSSGFGSMKSAMAGVVVGIGMSKVIGEYEQAQKVGRQTIAVIKSTGNAAQVSAAQQDKMVQSLSDLSAIDDEVIAQGANVLRTFTNIKGADTFEGALKAATDLSAAMGTDLQGSIVQVGKALNDPIKGVTALQRVGVSFTAQQKDQIKAMVESGDTMGAQKLILGELTKEFGGAAAANATDSARMKVAFDNAAESLGASLAPAMTQAAKGAEFLSSGFQKIPQPLQTAAVAGLALAYVGPKIVDGWKAASEALAATRAAASSAVAGVGGMGSAALLAAPAVAGLAYGLYLFSEHEATVAARAADVKTGITSIRQEASTTGKTLEEAFRDTVLVKFVEKMGSTISATGVSLEELQKGLTGSSADYEKLVKDLIMGSNGIPLGLLDQIGRLRTEMKGARSETKEHGKAVKELGVEESGAAGSTAGLTGGIDKQKASISAARDVIGDYIGEIKDLSDQRQASADADAAVVTAEQAREDAQRSARENNAAAAQALTSAETQLSDSRAAAAKAGQEVLAAEADLAKKREEATGNSDAARAAQERYNQTVATAAEKDRDAARAVLALDAARKGYQKTLSGLADDAADAAARNERQQIAIEEARKRVAEVDADPTKSASDRRLAELDLEQAIRDQRDTLDAANAAQETYNRNQAAGAEGSDSYVAASAAVDSALVDQAAAHKSVSDAADARAQVQVAADKAVSDAVQVLADKTDAANKAQAATVAAADGVAAAHAHVAQVAADGQKSVAEATQKATDAAVAAIWAHDALLVKLGLGGEAAKLTASELRTLASTLSPNNPLRQNLLDTATALENIAKVWEVTIKVGVTDTGGAVVAAGMNILAAVFPTRAKGGPVKKGHPYLVGEEGPELLVPDSNGQIMTATETAAMRLGFSSPGMHYAGHNDPQITWGNKPAGNLPVTTDHTSMDADMHNWGMTHSAIGMDPWHGSPAPTASTGVYDGDRLAKQIAYELALALPDRVMINAPIDARGMSAGSASTLVGVELAERVRTGSTTGKR